MPILTDKKVQMHQRDMDLVTKAVENVLGVDIQAMPASEGWDVLMTMDKKLGTMMFYDYRWRPSYHDEFMPTEWVEFFEKLAGPHGKTIFKTYQAKRGIKK